MGRATPESRPIRGYWHIAQMGNWAEVVQEQTNMLDRSGLLAATEQITVKVLGKEPVLLGNAKVEYFDRLDEYEWPTLNAAWQDATDAVEPFNAWYIHTKGVSWSHSAQAAKWRHYMEDCVIAHWRDCNEALKWADSVGVEFRTKPMWHWAGNFWWATSEQIRKRTKPGYHHNRGYNEMWILENWPKVHCFHNECRNLYGYSPLSDVWSDYTKWLDMIFEFGSDSLQVFGGRFEGGGHLQQRPEEIATALHYLAGKRINLILEIGAAAGGLSKLFSTIFEAKTFVIDDNQHPKHELRPTVLPDAIEFIGDSHSFEAKVWADHAGRFDLIVIDGDHSTEGVLKDTELALGVSKKGTILFYHDTVGCPAVTQAVSQIRRLDNRVRLFCPEIGDHGAGGLGITMFEVL